MTSVRVEPEAAGVRGELLEVLPDQRLAARQAELEHAQLARLGEDPLPVRRCASSPCGPDHLQRVRAVRAVQRTAMRQLGQQRGRVDQASRINSLSARCDRYSMTSAVTSV